MSYTSLILFKYHAKKGMKYDRDLTLENTITIVIIHTYFYLWGFLLYYTKRSSNMSYTSFKFTYIHTSNICPLKGSELK